ncbi:hypothetical protein BC938DRAFT_479958 [Jimgerdemannia flammicorona]|uniref:Uncharacterized protein n=1 Tax=Jimgerdemannia flammicorona TaxID=994334 RepID=A0A433R0P4_9FUNG|nr:hypothetical protein BC938DRAFT_479958 [Jimgerdemannia flammicorona]
MNYYRLYTPIRPTLRPRSEWVLLRSLSNTAVLPTTVGYGDMWDDKDNRPDHGELRGKIPPEQQQHQYQQREAGNTLDSDKVEAGSEEYVSGTFWSGDVGSSGGKHNNILEVVNDDVVERVARERAATDAAHLMLDEGENARQ